MSCAPRKPLWAPEEVFQELVQQGEVESVGSASIDWIGVPLKLEEGVTGVMVAQSYADGVFYNQEDLDLMEFVSTQVAVSIERKKAEDALRVSLEDTRQICRTDGIAQPGCTCDQLPR